LQHIKKSIDLFVAVLSVIRGGVQKQIYPHIVPIKTYI
jgi:hypothetical protein